MMMGVVEVVDVRECVLPFFPSSASFDLWPLSARDGRSETSDHDWLILLKFSDAISTPTESLRRFSTGYLFSEYGFRTMRSDR